MSRAIAALIVSIFFCTLVVASMVSNHGMLAGLSIFILSPISMFFALMIGVPALFFMSMKKWGAWWQSLLICLLIPQIIIRLILDENSHIYAFVLHISLGVTNGLILWIVGIFRNPAFTASNQKFPISILLAPIIVIPLIFYLQALESDFAYGCITDYQLTENLVSGNDIELSVLLDDGEEYLSKAKIKVNVIEADSIGSCAMGLLQPKASLKGSNYLVISTRARPLHCNQICPVLE